MSFLKNNTHKDLYNLKENLIHFINWYYYINIFDFLNMRNLKNTVIKDITKIFKDLFLNLEKILNEICELIFSYLNKKKDFLKNKKNLVNLIYLIQQKYESLIFFNHELYTKTEVENIKKNFSWCYICQKFIVDICEHYNLIICKF